MMIEANGQHIMLRFQTFSQTPVVTIFPISLCIHMDGVKHGN
ncbi:unnamed protein product [Brassica oleracea]